MKTLIKMLGMLAIVMNTTFITTPQIAKAQTAVTFQVFYDELSPYGSWVNYQNYGYVWIPHYGPEFMPYSSNGYWAYTEYGWTWVSYYRWGWAPFHYGRWDFDPYYGWFWIPDHIWGPAWVCWRMSPGYYGWAPLGPNISFAFSIGGAYYPPAYYWVFINNNYMGRPDIYQYYSPRKSNSGFIDNSQVITNSYKDNYAAGPKKEDVEKAGGIKVKQLSIKESAKPGHSISGNELNIYKPDIVRSKDENVKPAKIVDIKEVQPVSERKEQKPLEKNAEIKKKEAVLKENESKEEIKKQHVPVKEKIQKEQEQAPKMIEEKKPLSQPHKEIKKQEQPPKMVQPKMNQPKNYPTQPHKEIKKPDQPPRMVQPQMNVPKNPPSRPNQKPRQPHK